MEIVENRQLTQDIYQLDLTGEFSYGKVQAGQFVNILIGHGKVHPLRRPLSIAACDVNKQQLTLIYRVVGEGTSWLSRQGEGAKIDVLGPLGTGFPMPAKGGRVLIVGGGVGIPPLYELSKVLVGKDYDLEIVLGFKNQTDVFWAKKFAKFGQVSICTEDGSMGKRGFVTASLVEDKGWTSLYSCGPRPMLKALKEYFQDSEIDGYVSLEERMACGIGACAGCTCITGNGKGTKRVCKEGPVFPWGEVLL